MEIQKNLGSSYIIGKCLDILVQIINPCALTINLTMWLLYVAYVFIFIYRAKYGKMNYLWQFV